MKKVFVQLESGRGYGRDLLKGIYDYNNRFSKWEIIFEPAYYLKTTESRDLVKLVRLLKPDGCIIEHSERINEIKKLDIPIIQASWVERLKNIPCLKGNYEADGIMAAEYFLKLGFRNLAFFGVNKIAWSDGRFVSFEKHALQNGAEVIRYMFNTNKVGLRHNFDHLIRWLKSLPKPIGILSCNDDFGQMLINACSMGELKVPHEVAILGVDNDELLCNITYPNLSSISRNHTKAAYNACEILDRLMNGETVTKAVIPTEPVEIIVRSSTDAIACNDPEVIKAMQFIRNNINVQISVEDVVKVTNLSRRTLYSRFKQITGNTINDEIQLNKLKKFKELLKNRNLSVKEAAFSLGFNDVSHVSRWFSSIEGVPPLKWRAKV
jgi:LacI family transcriptional regulator